MLTIPTYPANQLSQLTPSHVPVNKVAVRNTVVGVAYEPVKVLSLRVLQHVGGFVCLKGGKARRLLG